MELLQARATSCNNGLLTPARTDHRPAHRICYDMPRRLGRTALPLPSVHTVHLGSARQSIIHCIAGMLPGHADRAVLTRNVGVADHHWTALDVSIQGASCYAKARILSEVLDHADTHKSFGPARLVLLAV